MLSETLDVFTAVIPTPVAVSLLPVAGGTLTAVSDSVSNRSNHTPPLKGQGPRKEQQPSPFMSSPWTTTVVRTRPDVQTDFMQLSPFKVCLKRMDVPLDGSLYLIMEVVCDRTTWCV